MPAIFGEALTEQTASWRLTETLCYLNHLERDGTSRTAGRAPARRRDRGEPNLDTIVSRLLACATVRIDEIIARSEQPVFSFEFFPPKTDEGEANAARGDGAAARARTGLRLGHLRRRRLDPRPHLGVTRWLKQELGIEAMAHLTCVGASVAELRATLDQIADAGIENVLALRGDPPAARTEWTPHPEGLSYSNELVELVARDYPFCVGAACFPEVHPQAADRRTTCTSSREGRQRRVVPDHPAVLRQRGLLPLCRRGPRRRHRRPDPARGSCRSPTCPDQDDHRDVWSDDPAGRCSSSWKRAPERARSRGRARRRLRHPAVRRAAGPAARPGSTSTRSTARRPRARSCRR